ncbi:IS5/IS1182 family transposase [Actinacidiphila rubida]
MDDQSFEFALRDLMVRDGCPTARRVGQAGDQCADVIASHPRYGHVVIQAKHTTVSAKVGSYVMYQVNGTAGPVLLAALAPTLDQAVRAASRKAYVLLDGTLLPIDRIATDRPFYSGKHKKHGMNVQVLSDPFGRLLWASPALPGAIHDVRAAREHGIINALDQAHIPCWADKGYLGARGTVRVPFRGRWQMLSAGQQAVNRSQAKIRALVEQAMATLKNWRLLRRLRCSTTRITSLVQAVLTLHHANSTAG